MRCRDPILYYEPLQTWRIEGGNFAWQIFASTVLADGTHLIAIYIIPFFVNPWKLWLTFSAELRGVLFLNERTYEYEYEYVRLRARFYFRSAFPFSLTRRGFPVKTEFPGFTVYV